jgi:hypothetical protein
MVAQQRTVLSKQVQVVDNQVSGQPQLQSLARLSARLSLVLTAELDYAVNSTGFDIEEFLLAGLCRAIAKTFGSGLVTVNGLTAVQPVQLCCATYLEMTADHLLESVRDSLNAGLDANSGADLVFTHLGLPPDPTFGPLQAADGAALGVLTYRGKEVLEVEWWYDKRRLCAGTIQELSDQFALGLIELTSEATPRAASAEDSTE